ncbi:hypothetical protein MRB53_028895 [Persea americana]|uniref:Uncharacterized protein n=1 Tax=Persea americana TaxID=3435 RepID=A0ACC2KGW2_PERAE|nr:hypothetical protein MRB53_028895 [Persea americana]
MGGYPSARRIWSLSASARSATARDGSESAGNRGRSGNSWMSSGSLADSFSGWLDKDSEDSERNRGFQGLECVLGAFWVVWFSKILFGKLSRYVDQEYFIRGEG